MHMDCDLQANYVNLSDVIFYAFSGIDFRE